MSESSHFSQPEQALLCITRLEAEVNNGGFDQYFFNSSGNWAPFTLEALTRVGAAHTAGIFRKALSVFPGCEPSPERHVRWEQMEQIADKELFGILDRAFYEEKENLVELLWSHIRQHGSAFAG